jgi:hypothetical protein
MGRHDGDRGAKYFQLAAEEQSIGSEERQLGNDDQLCGSERGLFRDSKELTHVKPLLDHARCVNLHGSTRRYRFLVGCATTLTLVFSILQLLTLLTGDVRMRVREETQRKPLDGDEPEIRPSDPGWPCGITGEEAREAGCYFDLGLIAWLPHACYNKELDESFRTLSPWEFWLPNDDNTGPNITKPITAERLHELPIQMVDLNWPGHSWSTLMFHDAHCLHAWQYMHQALLKGKKIPTSITRWSHTAHCTHEALMDTSNVTYREISPTAHNRYPACVELESLRG